MSRGCCVLDAGRRAKTVPSRLFRGRLASALLQGSMFPRARVWSATLLLLAACGGGASNHRPSPAPARPTPTLRILAVTDLDGALEPCGCTSRPLGGIDRLSARLSELRSEAPSSLFVVGNTFVGPERNAEPAFAEQMRLNEQALASILHAIHSDAVALGPADLALGLDHLAASGQAALPFMAANPGATEPTEPRAAEPTDAPPAAGPSLPASASLEVGDLHVGVFTMAATDARGDSEETPVDTARLRIGELKSAGAEFVVALVSTSRRETRRIARLEGVDLVIQAGLDRAEALAPSEEGGALVVNGGRQGQGLLVVDLYRRGDGAFHDASAWSRRARAGGIRAEAASLETRIREWERSGGVAEADLQHQRARLAQLRQSAADAEASVDTIPAEGNVASARLLELTPEVPRDPAIRAILEHHDRQVSEANRRVWADITPPEPAEGAATYVGSERCGSCHAAAMSWWSATPHGQAYATLERTHKEFDLECVGCHVTGYRQPGGSNVTHVENLKGVGCEVCHGAGSLHVGAPDRVRLDSAPAASICLHCHTEAHSDLFDFDAYRTMLIVPGHGQRETP